MTAFARPLELLAPAGTADIAIEAIKHGADAVYIGAPSHGARHAASNSLDDIRRVADFAHIFSAKVYVTVNTLVFEKEITAVERMIHQLNDIGVDALIVQDMGILRMDIPPIALHASTQCDIRTPEKARFLQEAGFSQLVLARELSISEIKAICEAVTIPVEVFVHGALCVSFSGRCSLGLACAGRSGNRGECPQICRQRFSLTDAAGNVLAKDKYLLSLKDFRAEYHLPALIEAGVTSFKIEGRLKEAGYVKNVTAAYSRRLNEIISESHGGLRRSSYGEVRLSFEPRLEKSFNRGFTDFCLSGIPDRKGMASIMTPKSLGEPIADISSLHPGDGISFFDRNGEFAGVQVNGVKDGKIIGNRPFVMPRNGTLYRTSSVEWKKLMAGETASRTLALDISLGEEYISAKDETGVEIRFKHGLKGERAEKPSDYLRIFSKLGNTPFRLRSFDNAVTHLFFPASTLTALRRNLVDRLLAEKKKLYVRDLRRQENESYPYPFTRLDYRDNVANPLAESFYRDHGVTDLEPALEVQPRGKDAGREVMKSRHCIMRELGLCLKSQRLRLPLTLTTGQYSFTPLFDCARCEMALNLH